MKIHTVTVQCVFSSTNTSSSSSSVAPGGFQLTSMVLAPVLPDEFHTGLRIWAGRIGGMFEFTKMCVRKTSAQYFSLKMELV